MPTEGRHTPAYAARSRRDGGVGTGSSMWPSAREPQAAGDFRNLLAGRIASEDEWVELT